MGIKKQKNIKMKFLVLLTVVALASADLFEVDVSEDVAAAGESGPSDRTVLATSLANPAAQQLVPVNPATMPAHGIADSEELDQFCAPLWLQQPVSPPLLLPNILN